MGTFADITGRKFGRITVIDLSGVSKNGKKVWNCVCDCGVEKRILSGSLLSGRTKSCGCLSVDTSRENATIHNHCYENIYSIYKGIKSRCYNKNHKNYSTYGGRGVIMCDRWLNDVNLFILDMGPRPSTRHSVDRIDNNGNYEPSNCKWSTQKEQCNNNSRNHPITWNGITKNIGQWAELTGINRNTIRDRINAGLEPEQIFEKCKIY